MEEIEETSLSLAERAHLNARSLYNVGAGMFWGIVVLMILSSSALVAVYLIREEFNKFGVIETVKIDDESTITNFVPYDTSEYPTELLLVILEHQGSIFALLFLSIIILSVIMAWLLVRGLRAYGRLQEWDKDYLKEAYILNFETTIPEGETTGEKILNQTRSVFPEIRTLKKKKGKQEKDIIVESLNYAVDSYVLDLALETKEGYFFVKDFKDRTVALEDLKQLVTIISEKFKAGSIWRIICVAKQYDQSFLERESLERLMTKELKAGLPIDLLREQKATYSVLWIST